MHEAGERARAGEERGKNTAERETETEGAAAGRKGATGARCWGRSGTGKGRGAVGWKGRRTKGGSGIAGGGVAGGGGDGGQARGAAAGAADTADRA